MDDSEIQVLDILESEHWWYENRRQILRQSLKKEPKDISILDLGSASGANSIFMNKLGFNSVTSVEYSDFGCELQRKKGLSVIQADARELPFNDSSFDLVVCMDVLEHIEDDLSAIKEIHRILKKNGSVLISVPEDMKLWSNHDVAVGHYRRYERNDLIKKFQISGLTPEHVFSSHALLKPIIKLFRKFSKGSDLKPVNSLLNLTLDQICLFERRLGFTRFSGTTLWAILKKNA